MKSHYVAAEGTRQACCLNILLGGWSWRVILSRSFKNAAWNFEGLSIMADIYCL